MFDWVSWPINLKRLFNAKFFLYIYNKYIGFGLSDDYLFFCIIFFYSAIELYVNYM